MKRTSKNSVTNNSELLEDDKSMTRKMVLLTWGYSNPRTAKTAAGLLRYCPQECVAVLDPDNAGRKAREFLDAGGSFGCPRIGVAPR
jgi:hypothetical protein